MIDFSEVKTYNFTYANLNSYLISWMQSNCQNISNFSSIDAAFKSGWSTGYNYPAVSYPTGHSGGTNYYSAYTYSNYITQISGDIVSNEFTPYITQQLSNIGLNVNDLCTINGIQAYYNFLINFTTSHIFYYLSPFRPNLTYMVYKSNNVSGAVNLPSIIIERSDVWTLLNNLVECIKKTTQTSLIQYKYRYMVQTNHVGWVHYGDCP